MNTLIRTSEWGTPINNRQAGDEILRRFLGIILAALAIQFVADGVTAMGF